MPTAARFALTTATLTTAVIPSMSAAASTFSLDSLGPRRCPQGAQRGGHEGSAGELYRFSPRDGVTLQTHRQLVEGLVSLP